MPLTGGLVGKAPLKAWGRMLQLNPQPSPALATNNLLWNGCLTSCTDTSFLRPAFPI
jgi:hypothetical protein